MRATLIHGPRDVRVETVPDPKIVAPTDVVVRVVRACICGSDLWPYRGVDEVEQPKRMGHEFMGVVEDVGAEVRTLRRGDHVVSPFTVADGVCAFCRANLQTSCEHLAFYGSGDLDAGQGEAVRVPFADGTLVKLPDRALDDETLATALLPLTDVLCTGHHAAVSAHVGAGSIVAVVGDGAVGLCGVLAAKRLGAERVVMMGRNEARLDVARRFGATDVVRDRGEAGVAALRDLLGGGAPAVLECVGTEEAMKTACAVARPGGTIGYVGVPWGGSHAGIDFPRLFLENVALRGGIAPARSYIPELLPDVLAGKLDASAVFDLRIGLDDVPTGYAKMDDRSALKAMIVV